MNRDGFTLLEVVVAVSILLTVVAITTGAMTMAIRTERVLAGTLTETREAMRDARAVLRETRCAVECAEEHRFALDDYDRCRKECLSR